MTRVGGGLAASKTAWVGGGTTRKGHGAGVTVNGWNVAGEEPQLVLPEGTSDLLPGLNRCVLIFFLDIVIRSLVDDRPETQLRIYRGTGVIAKAARELLSGGYVGCV